MDAASSMAIVKKNEKNKLLTTLKDVRWMIF